MRRSSRATIVSVIALSLLPVTGDSPASAATQDRLTATIALRFDDHGFGRLSREFTVEGPAREPHVARLLAARAGTEDFQDATLELLDRLGGDSERFADQLELIVASSLRTNDGRPAVTVREGRATIAFSGESTIGAFDTRKGSDAALPFWAESRDGSVLALVVEREGAIARDVHWVVKADAPNLKVLSRKPAPERDELVEVDGVKRRQLEWKFGVGETRPKVMLELKIHDSLRRTLAARWEVFGYLSSFAGALAASILFAPLLVWTHHRRLPRKGQGARAVARALRALSLLWVFLVAVAFLLSITIWLSDGSRYDRKLELTTAGAPVLAAGVVAIFAGVIASRRLLWAAVPLVAGALGLLIWLERAFLSFESHDRYLSDRWFRGEIAAAATAFAAVGGVLALVGLGALFAAGIRAAGGLGAPRLKHGRLLVVSLAGLLIVGLLIQIAAFINASFRRRQLVESMFGNDDPGGGWLQDLSFNFVFFPFNFHRVVLSLLPFAVLAFLFASFAHVGGYARSALFTSGDARYRPLVVLMFAGFVVGTSGALYGFAAPLAFVLTLALSRLFLRPTLERAQGRIDKLNGRRPRARSVIFRERRELLQRAVDLARIRRKQATLFAEFASWALSKSKYDQAYRESRLEAKRVTAGRRPYRIQLPPGISPHHLALALGPTASWWRNGRLAARWGLPLASIPLAFYLYILSSRRLVDDFSSRSYFGVLDVFQSTAYEVAFWLVAAFVLGALYAYLPGTNGALKGAALASLYGLASGVAVWILPSGGSAWFFRFLQLFLFLGVLGIVLDWRTLAMQRLNWRHLVDHYQLRDVRVAVGYLAPAIGALIVLVGQLQSGEAGDAITQFIKSIPSLVPPESTQ
jgi:hypothetical protein